MSLGFFFFEQHSISNKEQFLEIPIMGFNMKTKLFIATVVLALIVSCGTKEIKNKHTKKSKAELIEEVYVKSGLSKQIPSLGKHSDSVAKAYEARLPPAVLNRLNSELNKIYDPARLEKNIKNRINSNISEEVLLHMIKWYSTDVGKKITSHEIKSSAPEESIKKMTFMRENQNTIFPAKRLSLIKRLIFATNGYKMATDVGIYISMSILDMVNDMNPNTKPYTTLQLKKYVSQRRSIIRTSMEKMITIASVYIYNNLSDKELLAYVKYMERPKSKIFVDEVNSGIFNLIYTKADLRM
jgi:hypothetical protein